MAKGEIEVFEFLRAKSSIKGIDINDLQELLTNAQKHKTYKNYDLDLYNQILQNKKVLRTSKRNTLILPEYLDKIIYVYNGLTFKKLRITEDMIGTKFGQYIFTRKYCKHKVKNKILIKK